MPVPKFFKTEFDQLAQNNALGHPDGELAYGYLRVSSAGQADEGRSGLPRQIMHVHETAFNNGLKIPWEYLYADDDSGFEFANRPDLSLLREDYKSNRRRAHAVVIEHLDRLSRNADWHQGFLLDEMKQYGLHPVFWKQFTSRIERAVMGAIAQDGMEQAKQRMMEGNIHKAKSGRVTARTPAYGYKLVDSQGREGETAKKDTHYGIREDEAQVVRFIFRKIIEGYPIRRVAIMLEGKYPPPKKYTNWEPRMIHLIIKNTVYKGEFIAHNKKMVKVPVNIRPDSLTSPVVKMVERRVARPREEWIIVPVPAIVSAEEWELANKVLENNAKMSRRKAKVPFLLTGVIQCASCNYSFVGGRQRKKKRSYGHYQVSWYACASSRRMPVEQKRIGCDQGQIADKVVDAAVWSAIYKVLLDPQILISALEKEFNGDRNDQAARQIAFLEKQIAAARAEDEKLYKAYLAGVFNEIEFAGRRKLVKENQQKLAAELEQLNGNLISPDNFEEKKRAILMICNTAMENGLAEDAPFEVKQRIIKTVVENIILNVNENWFELQGVIHGRYPLFDENNPPSKRRPKNRSWLPGQE